jgi:bis(5'-nucleosyl)-tetraphosphatase (symmetrical)
MTTTYAIGDVQGCFKPMQALLEQIRSTTHQPVYRFLGDLVNRGPDSLQSLRRIIALGNKAQAVLGNHDLHLLAVAHGIRKAHRSDTLDPILQAPDCNELLDWVRRRPLALYENGHLLVHAGVLPQWSAEQTISYAQEVEEALRGPDWVDFLREMYGNEPAQWHDQLSGSDRLRCIVNALTRIRFCSADGVMDFKTKGGAEAALPGYMPWFAVPGRKTEDVTVVCGHWSALGLVLRPNLIALDTGCVWGRQLTAVRLEDRSVLQVECSPQ